MNHFSPNKRISILSIIFLIVISFNSHATNYIAVANGNWSSAATWSIGRAPADNDSILIPTGITVTVDINSPTYLNMAIYVQGTLNFNNGQKINMCPGLMIVFNSGLLTGGTPGSKINICGVTDWNGPGPTPGPLNFTSGTGDLYAVNATSVPARENVYVPSGIITLNWTVTAEEAGTSYEIMRSSNGVSYDKIATVSGNGISDVKRDYEYRDENASEGTNYYRITIIRAGKDPIESDKTASANNVGETKGCVLSVNPNPCVSDCQVRFSDCPSDNEGAIVVEMIDANGATVSSTTPDREANGSFSMNIDASNNLAPGVYIVRGVSSKKAYMQKAILK